MASPHYEAIFIHKDTKKRFKLLAVKETKTFDEMVEKLLNFYEANTEEIPQFKGTLDALNNLTIRK